MGRLFTQRTAILAFVAALMASPVAAQQDASPPRPAGLQAAALPKEADNLHVVVLVYGHKGGISAACQKDCKAFISALASAFEDDDDRLIVHDLSVKNPKTGKVYTAAETLAVIKSLQIGTNDNVVVFQSGHGSIGNRDNVEMSHRLTMDGGSLTRGQIQTPILAMKPRALLFLTDCCSGFSGSGKNGGRQKTTEPVSAVEPNRTTIRNLMLRPAGVVSITAAEDGKLANASYAGANPAKAGSAFTVALLRLWYKDTTFNTWTEFFPRLKTETRQASRGQHMARAFQLNDGTAPAFPFVPPILAVPIFAR